MRWNMFNGISLIGNPNCGKTTLYNVLTGKTERVGNRAGVTVDSKTGRYLKDKNVSVTDLPGTYSLKAVSVDERVVSANIKDKPKAIINVVDGTNLRRNLLLTCELSSLKIPMVIAINFSDELSKRGLKIDPLALSRIFGVPVVLISARKKRGVAELMNAALHHARVPAPIPPSNYEKVIENALSSAVKTTKGDTHDFTDKADRILMHKFFGIPIFVTVIVAVYFLTSLVGGFIGDKIAELFKTAGATVERSLVESGAAKWFTGLIVGAIIKGVGAVLSFMPQILVLFFLLAVIEESGYLARAAFLLDGIMEKVGLNGKSLISLGVSCGCAVGGVMSARTIESERTRRLTVFLSPFMPCGAKTAVFAWLSGIIFGGNPFITSSLYFLSLFIVAISGAILKRFDRFCGGAGLIMEIPVLRLPSLRGVLGALKEKTADFLLKAGSVIFLISVVVWFLQSFGAHGYTENVTESFLFIIGDRIKVLFVPLGFGNWQSAVAIVSGVFAKEAVIQTLNMVSASPAKLFNTGYTAYAFMAFIMFMPPCTAALSAAKNELKNKKDFIKMLAFQSVTAYLVALTVNGLGYLAENFGVVFLSLTIVVFGVIISVVILKSGRRCVNCRRCGEEKCGTKKANTTI